MIESNFIEVPDEFKEYLSEFGVLYYDSSCKEPVTWGYRIIKHLGEEKWGQLNNYGMTKCLGYSSGFGGYLPQHADWILITKQLTRQEAIDKYGAIAEQGLEENKFPYGRRKYTVFGKTKFYNDILQIPTQEEQNVIDKKNKDELEKQKLEKENIKRQEPTYDICSKCQEDKIKKDKEKFEKEKKEAQDNIKLNGKRSCLSEEMTANGLYKDYQWSEEKRFYGVYAGRKCCDYKKGASKVCPLYAYDREIKKKEKSKMDVEKKRQRKLLKQTIPVQ